jgi:dolichyl-phosphate beta-glucosyltransferase
MISFIIPSYKSSEALDKNLPYLLNYVDEKKLEYEILVVDDGSEDNDSTKLVVEKHNCKYLTYPKNKGKGGAVKHGMLNAIGDIKIFTDADIPFESSSYDLLLKSILTQDFDVVIGDRTLEDSVYFSEISSKRKMGSNFYTFFVGRIITTGIFDTQCGLKAFKKEVADDLFKVSRVNSFAFDVEVIYLALKRNYSIRKIPVKLRSQEGDSVSLLKHAPGMLLDLFKIKINHIKGYYTRKNE